MWAGTFPTFHFRVELHSSQECLFYPGNGHEPGRIIAKMELAALHSPLCHLCHQQGTSQQLVDFQHSVQEGRTCILEEVTQDFSTLSRKCSHEESSPLCKCDLLLIAVLSVAITSFSISLCWLVSSFAILPCNLILTLLLMQLWDIRNSLTSYSLSWVNS